MGGVYQNDSFLCRECVQCRHGESGVFIVIGGVFLLIGGVFMLVGSVFILVGGVFKLEGGVYVGNFCFYGERAYFLKM